MDGECYMPYFQERLLDCRNYRAITTQNDTFKSSEQSCGKLSGRIYALILSCGRSSRSAANIKILRTTSLLIPKPNTIQPIDDSYEQLWTVMTSSDSGLGLSNQKWDGVWYVVGIVWNSQWTSTSRWVLLSAIQRDDRSYYAETDFQHSGEYRALQK